MFAHDQAAGIADRLTELAIHRAADHVERTKISLPWTKKAA